MSQHYRHLTKVINVRYCLASWGSGALHAQYLASSYGIGPLKSKHNDDGSSKWVNDMPHNGWLDLSKPYIAAYKNKDTNVAKYIENDLVVKKRSKTVSPPS